VKSLAALGLLLLLTGCGGGGADQSKSPQSPLPSRSDLLFGYFGDACGYESSLDHINLVWAYGWCGDALNTLTTAKNAGVNKAVLGIDPRAGPAGWKWQFDRLRDAGVLGMIVALYPWDEPDVARVPASEIYQVAAALGRSRLLTQSWQMYNFG
jgi:hypothetical protein